FEHGGRVDEGLLELYGTARKRHHTVLERRGTASSARHPRGAQRRDRSAGRYVRRRRCRRLWGHAHRGGRGRRNISGGSGGAMFTVSDSGGENQSEDRSANRNRIAGITFR